MNRKTNNVVKLDTNEIRRAVRSIYLNSFKGDFDTINLSEIQISDREFKTFIHGEFVLYFDRHCHYTDARDHQIAIFLYLRALERVLNDPENANSGIKS